MLHDEIMKRRQLGIVFPNEHTNGFNINLWIPRKYYREQIAECGYWEPLNKYLSEFPDVVRNNFWATEVASYVSHFHFDSEKELKEFMNSEFYKRQLELMEEDRHVELDHGAELRRLQREYTLNPPNKSAGETTYIRRPKE